MLVNLGLGCNSKPFAVLVTGEALMRHHPSVDQVKADILNAFKSMTETETAQKQRFEAERLRRARRSIEELREQKRLREEMSDGWDSELH